MTLSLKDESDPEDAAVGGLVLANRILSRQGVFDGLGHVSLRHPGRADHCLMARNLAPDLVTAEDVVAIDLETDSASDPDARLYLERFIHTAIYRARPDVQAVVHSHAAAVLPFSVAPSAPLRPLLHTCGFCAPEVPLFEIRDVVGAGSDLLIRDRDLGEALAGRLRDANLILMRGHGYTVVGSDLAEAVFRAIFTQKNAVAQLAAQQLGEPVYLSPEEAAACEITNRVAIARLWELWAREFAGSTSNS